MGTVTVKFLGEEYQISEAVRDFLEYDQMLTPIYGKIVQCLSNDIQATSRTMTFDESVVNTIDSLLAKISGNDDGSCRYFGTKMFFIRCL